MSDVDAPVPTPPPRRLRFGEAIGFLVFLLALIGGVAYWLRGEPDSGLQVTTGRDPYIGEEACRDCHPAESARHVRSGHSRTLRPASERQIARELSGQIVPDPELEEVEWVYSLEQGEFRVERRESGESRGGRIDYAFGSGRHATTFLSLSSGQTVDPEGLENRLTYYAVSEGMGLTPGHARSEPHRHAMNPFGRPLTSKEVRDCFGCHTTRTSLDGTDRLDLDTLILGVSCESCHGAGRSHVEMARRGAEGEDLRMPHGPERSKSHDQMRLCGRCHGHPDQTLPGEIRPENTNLARFQPMGMMQSRCFQESRGAFTCSTCHDPHARPETDRQSYTAICLDCHQAPHGTDCPVSPRDGCVDCHMPRFDTTQRIKFSDHWIRIHDPSQPSSEPSS